MSFEMKLLASFILVLGVFTECTPSTLKGSEIFFKAIRERRSIKDALPKDDEFSQTHAISQMRYQVIGLENGLKDVHDQIEAISSRNERLENTLNEEKTLLNKMSTQFQNLQDTIISHGSTLNDLEILTSPEQNLFAVSNQTCGGVLVGQSGSIVFSSIALRGLTRYPSNCVWTIQANNRAIIKLSTYSLLGYRSGVHAASNRYSQYVVEVFRNFTGTNSTESLPFEPKVTKLQKNMHHIFNGPVIFVVFSLGVASEDYTDMDFHIQYEGMGKRREKETFFSHDILNTNSGNFTNNDFAFWSPSATERVSDNVNYTLDYTTFVISNSSTKVHLEAKVENGRCATGKSFFVISDLSENSTTVTDCCKNDCTGKKSLITYDNPFIVIILKKFQQTMNFNLHWIAETPYPRNTIREGVSSYTSYYKCGEILGGVGGSLSYKPHLTYRNSERCIWVIVPQPRPCSGITINVGANGVENTYDHLYMMELTDVDGEQLPNAPKITRLGRYGSYEALSREVYIVFYSDSTVTGNGFSLMWRCVRDNTKIRNDVTTRFVISREDVGSAISAQKDSYFTDELYEVFLLTPIVPASNSFGMQISFNQTLPVPTSCLHKDFTVYTAADGIFEKTDIECNNPGQATIQNADGMALIVLHSHNSSVDVNMNFNWREEYGNKGNNTNVVVEDNTCGGVIIGEKGMLKYKIGQDYFNNERCVWLLHSPNSTSITLKLLKDGFESCCDYLLVTTIEPASGTLKNDTSVLTRSNRTQTFEESLLVLAFRSDGSTRGKGFSLQFSGNGQNENPEYNYKLRHTNDPYGNIEYPSSDWEGENDTGKELLVLASSQKFGLDEDFISMPTNISWNSGVFQKANESCTYDSITFYTTPDSNGWLKRERYPAENATVECHENIEVSSVKNICSTVYSAFLAVYKLASPVTEGEDRRISFAYEKSAGCGGVFIGDYGEISYKEDGKYANGERCIWLVHAPQASKIRFRLLSSGFEECCDVLLISTVDSLGTPRMDKIISQNNKTGVVDGPIAIIAFYTDSSVTGQGFRLSYSTDAQITQDFPFTYHLEHRNRPQQNDYAFKVDPNEMVIVAYSPESHRSTYGVGNSQIRVHSFRPQIDTSCKSDSFSVYSFYGRDKGFILAQSFSAKDLLQLNSDESFRNQTTTGNCSAFTDSQFSSCNNIKECDDIPIETYVKANSSSYLAIYRSVNVTAELKFRGFVFVSSAE